eukprot:g14820.t1
MAGVGLNLTGLLPDERWIAEMQYDATAECQAFRGQHRADTIFVVTMAARIIQMQSGFAMLESAYQQPNNSANIMMKNMLDLCIGVLAFWIFGYYIAYHATHQLTGLADAGVDLAHWFCCFSYATTAATINSGALAGRVAFFPYLFLSAVMTASCAPAAVMPLSVSPLVGQPKTANASELVDAFILSPELRGFVAAILTLGFEEILSYFQIDDAVGAVAAHGPSGAWGAIAVALFADKHCANPEVVGLVFGGGEAAWQLMGIQLLGMVVLVIDMVAGFRCTRACELIGLDVWEHQFHDGTFEKDNDKATYFQAAKLKESLSQYTWWSKLNSPEKRYLAEQKKEELSKKLDANKEKGTMDMEMEVSILKKQVEMLQSQIQLLTLGKIQQHNPGEDTLRKP